MEVAEDLGDLPIDPPKKRDICTTCRRPSVTCWCQYLEPVDQVITKVYILQHPYEESRRLKTAPMIYHGLPKGKCHIYKGRRFPFKRFPDLKEVADDPHTVLLYPGVESCNLEDLVRYDAEGDTSRCVNLIVLDGTWSQAKGIYLNTEWLHSVKQVKISSESLSEYVIRTQPTDGCLSTVETVAWAISILEKKPEVVQALVRPLKALCDFQIGYGALKHQSKQFLIENGLYKWQNPKKDPFYKAKKTEKSTELSECDSEGTVNETVTNVHNNGIKLCVNNSSDTDVNKELNNTDSEETRNCLYNDR